MIEKKSESGFGSLRALLEARRSTTDAPTSKSTPSSDLVAALLGVSAKPIIQDRWFKDVTVHLDGYTFERCRFDRCKLVTEQATFVFRQCVISPDCELYFAGPALKIARLLMHTLGTKQRVQFLLGELGLHPQINSDGTFTLE